jgi:histidyl-tRNA synthetase
LFAVAGVPDEKIRSISLAVDKLDKITWADAKKEMVDEKGISDEVADQIGEYVTRSGDISEMLRFLKSDPRLCANENVKAGIDDMSLLISYLKAFDVVNKVSFDLSLARGLDYYTGLIFEVINKPPRSNGAVVPGKSDSQSIQVGSIAAGGRYDTLVGMYAKNPIPCVGISFGVDLIFTIPNARPKEKITHKVDVYIMVFGGKDSDGLLLKRMSVARQLWNAGIWAEFAAKVKPRYDKQVIAAKGSRLTVILGQDEVAAGQVRLKTLRESDDETASKDRRQLVSRGDLVEEVKKLLI